MFSSNVFDSLESQYDTNIDVFSSSLEEHYDKIYGLDDSLAEIYDETRIHLGSEKDLEARLKLDRGRDLHMIVSIVGDDEYTTTDSAALGPAIIGFGPRINGIRLSWKDTGESPYVGNYAEGWLLNPPSAEASFEVTNRRHGRSGVPWTLDMVKLKLLSPVRKQSPTWELDLESKLEHLAEIAGWTDRRWFTYDYHQMCLLLANAIFDFEDANTFPFLFKTEGGCGGAPPYGNLDTVYSAMHFYTRGQSKRGIIGLMEESVAVNTGRTKPKDTFFLRNSHLANLGDNAWLKYESAYRTLLDDKSLTRSQAEDLLKAEETQLLPDHILQLGTEVEPDSFAVGASLSALRKEGLLMSEMDVKAALDAQVRQLAILGDEPIGILNKRLEEESSAFRGKHLKVLSQLSDINPAIKEGLRARGMMMPTGMDHELRELMTRYYSMRTEEYARYSTLFYSDTIRVFKTSEVQSLLESGSKAIRADFARTESVPRDWAQRFFEENLEERARKTKVFEWFESKPLGELLYNPLPPGVGTDDARIARSVLATAKQAVKEDIDSMIVILFSGDRALARLTTELVRMSGQSFRMRMICIDRSLYTRMCIDGAQERARLTLSGKISDPKSPWRGLRPGQPEVTYWNYVTKSLWVLPQSVTSQIVDLGRTNLGTKSRVVYHIEYDYPNMERGLDLIRIDPRTGTIEEYGGGYLEGRTLMGFAEHDCWAKNELGDIYSWPDFDIVRSKRHYSLGRNNIKDDRILGFDPLSLQTYSKVNAWRRSVMSGNRRESGSLRRSSNTSSI
ncbi:RNA-dependent RNA polymerase [Sclerotinia sclerotiorum narnavirus 5]|uniref:RNA-dependent RNA polymerase n=1 Tax=Sclerotinia sclerotiorum narnavirus 5 TaxID=2992275 RepID=A0A9E7VBX0_9VIRU|nr:RNA-dependent RNA polymerase [Sclerotinia sclerotiorum narnavirus 5]